jgi:hypothetical protein
VTESAARHRLGAGTIALVVVTAAAAVAGADRLHAQTTYSAGQNVAPGFEGWEPNPDGSFNLIFGYMNRNWLEEIDAPVGPENNFSPGPADRGQPTHFLPRRNRFTFKVRVPPDFGDQELVWTLTTQGVTERAFGSLRPDYIVDNMIIASETGALGAGTSTPESRANTPPKIRLVSERTLSATVGQPLTLVARVDDDGLPKRRRRSAEPDTASSEDGRPELTARMLRLPSRVTVSKVVGLHLTWFVYRGEGEVTFDPPQIKPWEDTRVGANSPWGWMWEPPLVPEDGTYSIRVTFDRPGTYVLRARADDGGLYDDEEVTIVVRPVASFDAG